MVTALRLLILFIFAFTNICFSQSPPPAEPHLPDIIPPSPEAMSLGKYADHAVSMYTGLPNISIPLYPIGVRDIKLDLSLTYHASGIRVEQEASSVGLGW